MQRNVFLSKLGVYVGVYVRVYAGVYARVYAMVYAKVYEGVYTKVYARVYAEKAFSEGGAPIRTEEWFVWTRNPDNDKAPRSSVSRVLSYILPPYIYVGARYPDIGGVLSSHIIGNFERGCCQIIIQLFLGVCEQGFLKWSDLRSSLFRSSLFGPRCSVLAVSVLAVSVSTNKAR